MTLNHKKFLIIFALLLFLGAGCSGLKQPEPAPISLGGGNSTVDTLDPLKLNGTDYISPRNPLRAIGSTSTDARFDTVSTTEICLLGDICRTTWPTGGSGGGSGITPFSPTSTFVNDISVTDGSTTSSLGAAQLAVATSSANRSGVFNVNSSGDITTSGTLSLRGSGTVAGSVHGFSRNGTVGTWNVAAGNTFAFTVNNANVATIGNTGNTAVNGTFTPTGAIIRSSNEKIAFGAADNNNATRLWDITTALQTQAHVFAISAAADTNLLMFDENGNQGVDGFVPPQADPTFIFRNGSVVANDKRLTYFSQQTTTSLWRAVGTPSRMELGSSTLQISNIGSGANTTTVMVTSTGSGGTAETGETTAGRCFQRYVDDSFVQQIEPCGKDYGLNTSTFR